MTADEHVETLVLDEDAWNELMAMLDAPPRPSPRLAALLDRPERIVKEAPSGD